MEIFEGGCRCGAVRWRLTAHALPLTYACHCLDCQTWSGSAFSQHAVAREEDFSVSGNLGKFELHNEGRVSLQYACPNCFARVYNTNSARPGLVVIRAGTFDDSNRLRVAAHIWTKRRQPWISLPAEDPAWQESAPPTDLFAAIGAPVPKK